jgi:redox-sensitive bicupin YhaK (pirin superfamily)
MAPAPADATSPASAPGALLVVPDTAFFRLTEREFGMPGLVAIESIGPFVEHVIVGPFLTIHDSTLAPGLGIGHHPHRGNERLFYILRGEIRHDDSLNGITGVMAEGDLARLTEGRRGMVHREWNGRDDVTTHAFILVYTPDVEPPIETASFAALRAADAPRVAEAPGVATTQLIGGGSAFRASSSAITGLSDSALDDGATLEAAVPAGEAVILYPLAGTIHLDAGDAGAADLRGTSQRHPEGPGAMAVLFAGASPVTARLRASGGPARVLRVGFRRTEPDIVRR